VIADKDKRDSLTKRQLPIKPGKHHCGRPGASTSERARVRGISVTEERWRTFVILVPRYSPVTRDDSSRREATARSPPVQLIPSITMAFVQVCRGDVQLGAPIRFPIYTANGRLLLNRGCCISSEAQLERLFDVGAYRDDSGLGARNGSGSARSILISSANHRPTPSAATAITVDFPALTQDWIACNSQWRARTDPRCKLRMSAPSRGVR
jgi:hypothetical protein